MKKLVFFIVSVFMCINVVVADDVVTTDVSKLPVKARNYLKYFKSEVLTIEIDENLFGKDSYEVRLENGAEIEFDGKGEWREIDCKMSAVPMVLVPKTILSYVKKHFPKAVITHIEKDSKGYDVELSNDVDLKFNATGQFVKLDD